MKFGLKCNSDMIFCSSILPIIVMVGFGSALTIFVYGISKTFCLVTGQ